MADFEKSTQRNLVKFRTRLFPHQLDYFETLKLQKSQNQKDGNVSHFVRQAIEEKIERDRQKVKIILNSTITEINK